MKQVIHSILVVALCLSSNIASAQIVPISQEGVVNIDCGVETVSLTDSDVNGGNYAPGEVYTITLCPTDGNFLEFNATPEAMGAFELALGDFLYIYDGEDDTAPFLGSFGNEVDPGIGFAVASSFDNPSGCLTLVFISGGSSPGAPGFIGTVTCTTLPLPFNVTITSDPADEDGYIDICQGDNVTLSAVTDYLYSGQGYDQSDATSSFLWEFPDGTTYEGVGLTTIPAQTFNDSFGYLILLTVTDQASGNGYFESAEIKVRVSTTPDFSGIIAQYQDTICLGGTSTLIGGVTPDSTTSFGVLATQGAFVGGGVFGEQLFLPDGTGQLDDIYQTTINIDDFEDGTLLTQADDIVSICVTMEHTFLGDLEMWLECPDGTQVTMFDTHVNQDTVFGTNCGGNVGFLDGGWCPGGVNLGNANQGTDPGEGFQYCFTPGAALPAWGSEQPMPDPVPEGDYQPEGDFADFIGCEVNGDWTLNIADNWGGDDGWVFNWSIVFNPDIDPNAEFYTPELVYGIWDDEPTIIDSQSNDTLIVVQPGSAGEYFYTFNITDNFGCDYDTTVTLQVIEPITIAATSPACDLTSTLEVFNSYQGGAWSYEPSDSLVFFSGGISGEASIQEASAGDFVFTYSDFFCQTSLDVNVFFPPYPDAAISPDTSEICIDFGIELSSPEQPYSLDVNWNWSVDSVGSTGGNVFLSNEPSIEAVVGGDYTLLGTSVICPNMQDFGYAYVNEVPCIIETYNIFTPNGDGVNDVFFIQAIDKFKDPMVYVYNRWGNVVYEKANYRNNWDMDGLPDGTYYYIIHNPANNESFKGYFTLTR